jgi:hypothetical protein
MGFLRRLIGGGRRDDEPASGQAADDRTGSDSEPADVSALDDLERAHELEVLREEQGRLGDLQERQLRYARYAWQPPSQGGERRADDADGPSGG